MLERRWVAAQTHSSSLEVVVLILQPLEGNLSHRADLYSNFRRRWAAAQNHSSSLEVMVLMLQLLDKIMLDVKNTSFIMHHTKAKRALQTPSPIFTTFSIPAPQHAVTTYPLQSPPQPVTNQRINPMTTRTETPQLHLLPAHNLPRITIAPLQRHLRVCIRVYQHVECALPCVELREKGHGGGNLPEDGLDLGLDLGFCFFFWCGSGGDVRGWCAEGY